MKLQRDLREFIELLNSLKVDYLIVGGHAVAYHGYPRYTGDIDMNRPGFVGHYRTSVCSLRWHRRCPRNRSPVTCSALRVVLAGA